MTIHRYEFRRAGLVLPALMLMGPGAAQVPPPGGAAPPQVIVLETLTPKANPQGAALTVNGKGAIDANNPFFKPFGNGRTCASCHTQAEGWSITPQGLQARFNASAGLDPIFRLNDGANSPRAAASTIDQKRLAYSMLLTKGLIRVGMPVPANAEFSLQRADDPYGYASAAELSLFRRPLPSANLQFAATVMWDARETFTDARSGICIRGAVPARCFATLDFNLLHQANSAVTGHAEAAAGLSAAEQRSIVDFEKSLVHAQSTSNVAGDLTAAGALGGPAQLSTQPFYFGINDIDVGDYVSGAAFNRNAFNLFGAWRNLRPVRGQSAAATAQMNARLAIARGEALFNNRPMNLAGVAGFSDELRPILQRGTCTSCHNATNSGAHSIARTFNTGVAAGNLRTPDMPLYTLRNKVTGATVQTTDPGAAMVSGRWNDIGKFKTPNLRGASARAPFFHDGSARDMESVVRFYDRRFRMGMTAQEVADMSAFLKAL